MRFVYFPAIVIIFFIATMPILHGAASQSVNEVSTYYKDSLYGRLMRATTTEALAQRVIYTHRQEASAAFADVLRRYAKNEPRIERFIPDFVQQLVHENPDKEAQAIARRWAQTRAGHLYQARSLAEARLLAGSLYHEGLYRVSRNDIKALELYNQAAEDESAPIEVHYRARMKIDNMLLQDFQSLSAAYSLSIALVNSRIRKMLVDAATYYTGRIDDRQSIDYQKALELAGAVIVDPEASPIDRAEAAYIAGMIRYRGGHGAHADYVEAIRYFSTAVTIRWADKGMEICGLPKQTVELITALQNGVIRKLQREESIRQRVMDTDACDAQQVLADPRVISHFIALLRQEIADDKTSSASMSEGEAIAFAQTMEQHINSRASISLAEAKLLAANFLLHNTIRKDAARASILYTDIVHDPFTPAEISREAQAQLQAQLDILSTPAVPTYVLASADALSSSPSSDISSWFNCDDSDITALGESVSASSSSSARRSEPTGGRDEREDSVLRQRL